MEILLSSANTNLVGKTKEIAVDYLSKLPQESKNQQLILTTEEGFEHLFHTLEQVGADLRARDRREGHMQNTMLTACMYRNSSIIRSLLQNPEITTKDLKMTNTLGMNTLHVFLNLDSNIKLLNLLLDKMSQEDVEARTESNSTALHLANDNTEAIIILLDKMSCKAVGHKTTKAIQCYI